MKTSPHPPAVLSRATETPLSFSGGKLLCSLAVFTVLPLTPTLCAAGTTGAVKVPSDLPWHFCPVSGNGLKSAPSAAGTYDPRKGDGKGDWAGERFPICPDGRYQRHIKIHPRLAAKGLPKGWFRGSPAAEHQFMESIVIGPV